MDGVRKIREMLDRILELVQIGLFGVMVAVGTYQILVRYLFNRPSTVSEELLTYAFAWLSLLAAAYMFGKRGHMRMGFLADKAKGGVKLALEVISECLVLLFAVIVMLYGGVQITSLTMAQKTASLGIPMGYVYSIVPFGGGMIFVYSVLNLAQMMRDGAGGETAAAAETGEPTGTEETERLGNLEKNKVVGAPGTAEKGTDKEKAGEQK